MRSLKIVGLLGVAAAFMGVNAATDLRDIPVAANANRAYLTDMEGRPWWNKAWKKRAPILVSNMAAVRTGKATIDFVFDPGEAIDLASVRVVTPWETLVDCVAEPIRRTDTPVRSAPPRGTDTLVRSDPPRGTDTPVRSTSPRGTDTLVRSDKDGSSSRNNGQECPFSENNGQECPFPDSVRIIFQTDFRENENKPFFVYYNRRTDTPVRSVETAGRTDKSVRSPIALSLTDSEVYVNNGCLEVVFDNLHRTPSLIKRLKVNASQVPSELLWRTTGFAWEGFSFETDGKPAPKLDPEKVRPGNAVDAQIHKPDVPGGWSKAFVTADNALVKTITFTNEFASLDFTFYALSPRVDYAYRLAPGVTRTTIGLSWACGGDLARDEFYYPGYAGKTLTMRAALDWISDCEKGPMEYYRFPYFGKGWYAFADSRSRDVVGMVFDRDSFAGPAYLAGQNYCGETARMIFAHNPKKGECATGSGALVATVGGYKDVEREYELLKNRPRVFVAKTQPYREIVLPRRDLAHDWCVNYNCGGWKSSKPLPGTEWAENIVTHLRERGANTVLLGQLTDYNWTDLPVPEDLYNRICAYAQKKLPGWKAPPRDGKNFKGDRLRQICDAAHAKGMAVCTWHSGMPGISHVFWNQPFDPEYWQLIAELQALYPKCGVDSVFCAPGGGEGQPLPEELIKKNGREYWKWADPTPYFDCRRTIGAELKKFTDYSHKVNPDARVMVFNSDNGELNREGCMAYYPNAMDTLFCEFCEGDGDLNKIKHVAKRLRSYFDNPVGHTIHAHYYCMKLDHAHRIFENEQHFICGIHGFSNEAMTYENTEPENSQYQADFYRFAEYTRLGPKAAKMAPVKNLAVLRDAMLFEEDIRKKRTLSWGWGYPVAQGDIRVNCFARIPNCSYDIVMNPFFKADSLRRYKAVYVPEDDVFSDELAQELLKYVREGGGAVVEGVTGMKSKSKVEVEERRTDTPVRSEIESDNSTLRLGLGTSTLTLKPGEVKAYGKGKIVWTKEVLSQGLVWNKAEAKAKVSALVASVGGEEPFKIEKANGQECPFSDLDGVLQSGPDGMLLGVFNRGKVEEKGVVTLDLKSKSKVEVEERNEKFHSSPSTSNFDSLFVLDVKSGVRIPVTNNTFTIAVGPRQCGFYLIGDDAFTAVPEAKESAWLGASAASTFPKGRKPLVAPKTEFVPRACVEFVTPAPRNYAGLPAQIERSEKAMLKRHRFCAEESKMSEHAKTDDFEGWMALNADGARCYTRASFARALKEASYVHIQCWPGDCDDAFEDCADELKALLKRGGGLFFSRTNPGPKAQKFLKEIGVFDPSPSIKKNFSEPAKWSPNVSTNHALFARKKAEMFCGSIGASSKYTAWDKEKQFAPFVDAIQPENALMVVQENVLGAGRVVFSLNRYCFTSWYENTVHGDTVLSYLLGLSVDDHAKGVLESNGGPGKVVK